MKTSISYSLIAAAMACGFANAQTTAYTTPVGYFTSVIAGAGANPSADTYISSSLVQPTVFAGAANASPSGTTTVAFAGASVPAGLGLTYVLEITSGPSVGWWSTVTSSTTSSVTVSDSFPAGLAADVTVSVRKHNTLKSYLGDNAPGLTPFDGIVTNYDEVQVLDASLAVVTSFAYVTAEVIGLPEGAWLNLGSSEPDDRVIEPGSSIKIKRLSASGLSFVASGTVKTTPTQVDLYPNFNWIGTQIANGKTLNGMNLNTTLIAYDGISPNYDELQIVAPDQSVTPYAAADGGAGFTMFNLSSGNPDGDTVTFAEGTGAILNRIGNPSSTILVPGTVVAP